MPLTINAEQILAAFISFQFLMQAHQVFALPSFQEVMSMLKTSELLPEKIPSFINSANVHVNAVVHSYQDSDKQEHVSSHRIMIQGPSILSRPSAIYPATSGMFRVVDSLDSTKLGNTTPMRRGEKSAKLLLGVGSFQGVIKANAIKAKNKRGPYSCAVSCPDCRRKKRVCGQGKLGCTGKQVFNQACLSCKRLKIKCNGQHPHCAKIQLQEVKEDTK